MRFRKKKSVAGASVRRKRNIETSVKERADFSFPERRVPQTVRRQRTVEQITSGLDE